MDLHSIRFLSVFVRFFTFLLFHKKVCNFSSAFIYVSIRANQIVTYWTRVSEKKIFCKEILQLYFEISLLPFIYKIFEQNFYQYITIYFVRIWTYKNADEKAHTFLWRSKNGQKSTKNGYCEKLSLVRIWTY